MAATSNVHFGTDGWRAVIGEDFVLPTLAKVAVATARAYRQLLDEGREPGGAGQELVDEGQELGGASQTPDGRHPAGTLLVGYDCRQDAAEYAAFVAGIVAAEGFEVLVSDRFCPTPALCWTIAQRDEIVGGIMLTASHNPAEYLGVKLRMDDGGASPNWFTDIVEGLLAEMPGEEPGSEPTGAPFQYTDIMSDYLQALTESVDTDLIHKSGLSVVIDPMFGAGRGYLAGLLRSMGVAVAEVNGETDPSFNGLHPEPILPWVSVGAAKVTELGYDACLVTDGDGDRIGAVDGQGVYVTSHRLMSLLISHLVEDRGRTGRVVRTSAGSNLLQRQCRRLGLTLVTKPIGFKWIYEEMLDGDVLIGGEESGGIGIPDHVRERDGLLCALLLVEMMAQRRKTLSELVDELLGLVGVLEYKRRDLRLDEAVKERFLARHVRVPGVDAAPYAPLFEALGEEMTEIERVDGIMLRFASDAWLLVRPSGTEPLVRVYAEAIDIDQVERLLDIGCDLALGNVGLELTEVL